MCKNVKSVALLNAVVEGYAGLVGMQEPEQCLAFPLAGAKTYDEQRQIQDTKKKRSCHDCEKKK